MVERTFLKHPAVGARAENPAGRPAGRGDLVEDVTWPGLDER
ncbi:hypothetical protein [Pseudofrankia asymbiotica]|nr:hypothetical protein [Pseudofrankia asymbiotica]